MDNQEEQFFNCPACAGRISVLIDFCGEGKQEYVSDCEVCCRPIVVSVSLKNGQIVHFEARKENE